MENEILLYKEESNYYFKTIETLSFILIGISVLKGLFFNDIDYSIIVIILLITILLIFTLFTISFRKIRKILQK